MALFNHSTSPQIPKIRMTGVSKSFGSKKVLNGLDLDIYAGESLVIIGGSGTGKSVTLKCILGLLKPESGQIEIDGKNPAKIPTKEREKTISKIGMLFQNAALFDSLSVWENVSFSLLQNKKMSRKEARKIAIKKLAQVGLKSDVADVYPELEKLLNNLLPKKALHEYGVTEQDLVEFTESVMVNQGRLMANNFVELDKDRVYKIYKELF
jgi:phospholipid/cholesterol/gamma-HCH transport system ATP-binding protein